jgi:hypothetical protein
MSVNKKAKEKNSKPVKRETNYANICAKLPHSIANL